MLENKISRLKEAEHASLIRRAGQQRRYAQSIDGAHRSQCRQVALSFTRDLLDLARKLREAPEDYYLVRWLRQGALAP